MKSAAVFALAVVALAAAGTIAADSGPFAVSAPAAIMDVDSHAMKGDPVELAWSGTSGQFYVQTVEGYTPNVTVRHYLIRLGDKAPSTMKAQPDWANTYWASKSRRDAPAATSLLIDVRDTVEANRLPTQSLADRAKGTESGGGDFAMKGAEAAANDHTNAAQVRTLVLKGVNVGRFVDTPLVPGLTFGWSPPKLHAIAYVDDNGRLGVFDYTTNGRQVVDGTKDVLLPAWSPDGSEIAFLERTGRKRYSLERVKITLR